MSDSPFPAEVPQMDDAVRITPVKEDYVGHDYKFFCEECHVRSRFFAVDHADSQYVEIAVSGEMIRKLRFNLTHSTWSIHFDGQQIQVEVEKILQ